MTRHQLSTLPPKFTVAWVYVCENPAVLRRAAGEIGPASAPVLCTDGVPSTAFHRLARAIHLPCRRYRCSVGFNVMTSSGASGFITAGHCGNVVSTWYSDSGESNEVATTGTSAFPGTDYSIATYTDGGSHASEVDLYNGSTQSISGAADATVGESVQRSGSTSGLHGGTVNAVDASVTYEVGTVNGLIDTDVCAEPGDSGGALFGGNSAVGLTSGGSGDCTSGGETFSQPATAALSALGASIG